MDIKPTAVEDVIIDCEICFQEIPISEARSEEATDYVHHFCGLDCYARWQAQTDE